MVSPKLGGLLIVAKELRCLIAMLAAPAPAGLSCKFMRVRQVVLPKNKAASAAGWQSLLVVSARLRHIVGITLRVMGFPHAEREVYNRR
jgi:hypothetical protein